MPEFEVYIERNPEKAGELTRKEAGMMAEILTIFALEQGMNVLVDGSLKDAQWYGTSQKFDFSVLLRIYKSLTNNSNNFVPLIFSFWATVENYFISLRNSYPRLKIGIIHVTAPTEAIFERVEQRAKVTGRAVPLDALRKSIDEVPKAVKRLQTSVDFFLELDNPTQADDSSLPESRWMSSTEIKNTFRQKCDTL